MYLKNRSERNRKSLIWRHRNRDKVKLWHDRNLTYLNKYRQVKRAYKAKQINRIPILGKNRERYRWKDIISIFQTLMKCFNFCI